MPDIVYDGKKISVAPGTNLIEAGLDAGVPVPVFCYHKSLGAVGSCRVCAVTVTMGGKSRMVMGCMTEAADGMEVTTLDDASVKLRKYVLEWLMENHPHDCPICDEGGECQLQDLTIAAGQSIRRYRAKKRTFNNQYLGEFIVHEMNRCITCYRCSRFYQEIAGGTDFGPTGSRDRVYFGRFEEGPLESPFSGNLVELCPTGVFTDKLFRYKSRVWDLEIAPSVCPHCSVGCNLHPGSRHRELQRVRVRENEEVNGAFLCDRGQFGHRYVMDPERPREIRVRSETQGWDEALGLAGGSLVSIAHDHGAASIALIASARASVETHAALEALASGPLEGASISHFDDPDREPRAIAALAALRSAGLARLDQADIAECDVLVIVGASLVDEAPLTALAARQVARRGGRVIVLAPGEHYLNDVAERIVPAHPAKLAALLTSMVRGIGTIGGVDDASAVTQALSTAERPGILIGTDLVDGPTIAAGAELAKAIARGGKTVRLGYLFPGPNAFGAAALSRGATLTGILADLEAGKIKAAVMVESDTREWSPKSREALKRLDLLIALDHLKTPLVDAATVFLPTTATFESHGSFVNRAGRAQAFVPDRVPGLSVIEMIDHETFPRQPRHAPPASTARAAWSVLELLRDRSMGKPEARNLGAIRVGLGLQRPFWEPLREIVAGSTGLVLDVTKLEVAAPSLGAWPNGQSGAIFRMDRTLGTEILSRDSEPMRKMAGPPTAWISVGDAERAGANGRVALEVGGQSVELDARPMPTVPDGVVLVPRDVEWPNRIEQGAAVRVRGLATAGVGR